MTRRKEILKAQELAIAGALFAPDSFKLASIEELLRVCNGCGAKGAWFRPPKRMCGTLIVYACIIHDWMYEFGLNDEDKQKADRSFLNNLNRLITLDSHKWYKPTKLQRKMAKGYYNGVKYGGGEAFWRGK